MLCITRKEGQGLRVGGAMLNFRIKGNKVVVSVDAPREVPVLRDELAKRADDDAYHRDHTAGDCDEPGF